MSSVYFYSTEGQATTPNNNFVHEYQRNKGVFEYWNSRGQPDNVHSLHFWELSDIFLIYSLCHNIYGIFEAMRKFQNVFCACLSVSTTTISNRKMRKHECTCSICIWVKYLVVVQVVRQSSYKQFVGGIRNNCGDDTCRGQSNKRSRQSSNVTRQ